MTALAVVAAACAGWGAHLLYTSLVLGWGGVGAGPARRHRRARPVAGWLAEAGLEGVAVGEFVGVVAAVAAAGAAVAWLLFGAVLPAALAAVLAGATPLAGYRARRRRRMEVARQAWPRMLEELRLATGALGRSIPQALLEVGRRAPAELAPAFAAAEREWLLSTDFGRALAVLQAALADPTADAVCETLLVAHEVGGSDLGRRLGDLIDDRVAELDGRRDAQSKLAGVRFARRFVLVVPLGMALAGLSIGDGRAAYATTGGQLAVAAGLLAVAACWVWSGRLLRLPDEPRVYGAAPAAPAADAQAREAA